MRNTVCVALLLSAIGCSTPPPPPPPPGPAEDQITAASLVDHLKVLASDEYEGRAPATPGGQKTQDYLAQQLKAIGIEPGAPDGTYFQQVPIVESAVERNFVVSVPGNTYKYMADVVAFSGVEKARVQVQGEVVFVGYGINAPELKWNDYAGANVRGKWVMIMVNDPPAPADEPTLFGGTALTYYGRWTYKFEEAARQGAAGALLIHTDESATYPWQVVQTSWSGTQYSLPPQAGEPALGIKAWITNAAAKDLAKRGGRDLDTMRAAASKRGFKPVTLNIRAAATLMQRSSRKTAANVIGVLKGTNTSEGVIYSAHWDHFGIRDPQPGDAKDADRIFNGAYDNASGCAGVLEIAKAFAKATQKPARSIYFAFVTAEESGLLGSAFLAANPPLPIDKVAANINIDGVNYLGATKDMVQLGSERSTIGPMIEAILKERSRTLTGDTHPERGYFFRSDHFSFAKLGVPAISLSEPRQFTGANAADLLKKQEAYNDKDYHQPSDQYDASWDFTGGADDMKVLTQLGWRIAAQPEMPKYNAGDQFGEVRKK
ncbi:MAG TPA: M20/M25/M40 family metallo-hydrolase [Vicinamibacterales bacterium]|nr:M20/M25/M40 family metallo-hydrolase [Vicinamibacterales bacterium]